MTLAVQWGVPSLQMRLCFALNSELRCPPPFLLPYLCIVSIHSEPALC